MLFRSLKCKFLFRSPSEREGKYNVGFHEVGSLVPSNSFLDDSFMQGDISRLCDSAVFANRVWLAFSESIETLILKEKYLANFHLVIIY